MRSWAGIAIGLVLLITWVVAFVVMKVTSVAIHLLVIAAVVVVVSNAIGHLRGRMSGPGAGQ